MIIDKVRNQIYKAMFWRRVIMSEKTLKIEIVQAPPIDPAFKVVEGKVYEVTGERITKGRASASVRWWIRVDGERIGLFGHEAKVVEHPDSIVCDECGETSTKYNVSRGGWLCETCKEWFPTCTDEEKG